MIIHITIASPYIILGMKCYIKNSVKWLHYLKLLYNVLVIRDTSIFFYFVVYDQALTRRPDVISLLAFFTIVILENFHI